MSKTYYQMYLFLWKRGCFLSRLDVCREMTGKCKLNLDIVVFASVVELENHIHYLTVTTRCTETFNISISFLLYI